MITPGEPVDLVDSFSLNHDLQGVIPTLRAIRYRHQLLGSPLWRDHGEQLVRVAEGLEFRRHPAPDVLRPRPFVRVAAWNIQRGKRLPAVMAGFRDQRLRSADVIILNEVDIGMARSGQHNIARLIADELAMHYVFGNHYLCLDGGNPRDRLVFGVDGVPVPTEAEAPAEENQLGLHGNAILSRFPLRRAENVPLFETKDKFRSRSEKRFGVKKALWADVETPFGPLVVAAVHLDSVTSPSGRARQIHDLLLRLDAVAPTRPALLGGDWNTTTYDLQSPWRLLKNLAAKFLRGGFPHAVPEYMRPYRIYEKPIFDVVEGHRFDWRSFNALDQATMSYDVDDPEAAHAVRERVGGLAVKLLRRQLAPWGGKAPLKVDWFAGRGCRPASLASGNETLGPRALERFRPEGEKASDHDPILVDVTWDAPSAAA